MDTPTVAGRYGRLTDLEVEMNFVPIQNPHPKMLTPAQIAQWNEQGFISNLPILDSSELKETSAFFRGLEQSESGKAVKFNTHARHSQAVLWRLIHARWAICRI